MAIEYNGGTSATGFNAETTFTAGAGILSIFAGTAATPISHFFVATGLMPDSATVFQSGTSSPNTCDLITVESATGEVTLLVRFSPTAGSNAGQIQLVIANTAGNASPTSGTFRAANLTMPSGTLGQILRAQRWLYGYSFDTSTRIATTYLIFGEGDDAVTLTGSTTALTAGVGLWLADSLTHGAKISRSWPGRIDLTAFGTGTKTQADFEAMHDAADAGWILETYRTSILYADHAQMSAVAYTGDTAAGAPGQAVTNKNFCVYGSNDASWIIAAAADDAQPAAHSVAVTGSPIAHVLPGSLTRTLNQSLVADGGFDITTRVWNQAVNPALVKLATGSLGGKTVLAQASGNSHSARNFSDESCERLDANDTYHADDSDGFRRTPASLSSQLAMVNCADQVVGMVRTARNATGSSSFNAAMLGSPKNVFPSTGTVTHITGASATASAMADFSRLCYGSTADTSIGIGQCVHLAASAGIDFIVANMGAITPSTALKAYVLVAKHPSASTATLQAVSHASSGATTPFGNAGTNYAAGTTHGSAVGPTTLSTSVPGMNGTVVSYSAGTPSLTVGFLSTVPPNGYALVVDRGGVPCLGIATGNSFSSPNTTFTLEHTMGNTTVPQAADTWSGGLLEFEWLEVDIPASISPSPWRGVRITAGASGLGVMILNWMVVGVDGDGNWLPGVISGMQGQGGNGYALQLAKVYDQAVSGGQGPFVRYLKAYRDLFIANNAELCHVLFPATQSSLPADVETMAQKYLDAGWLPKELAIASKATSGASASTMTYGLQDHNSDDEVGQIARDLGVVGIGIFPRRGTPIQRVTNCEMIDAVHSSALGYWQEARELLLVAAPVSSGGLGAAEEEDGPSGGSSGGDETPISRFFRIGARHPRSSRGVEA